MSQHEAAINEDVNVMQEFQLVGRLLLQFFPGIPRPGPDILSVTKLLPQAVNQFQADLGVKKALAA